MKNFIYVAFITFIVFSSNLSIKTQGFDPSFERSRTVIESPDRATRPLYTPGFAFGGIPFDDSQFYEIKPEKCESENTAEILGKYELTENLYLFKTNKGYGVISLEQTLKELSTGQRRKRICPINIGMKLSGEVDCKGIRVIKESPFKGCAFDAKIWGHSMSEYEAFNLIYQKLNQQFKAYKKECVLPPKRSLQDRLIKF